MEMADPSFIGKWERMREKQMTEEHVETREYKWYPGVPSAGEGGAPPLCCALGRHSWSTDPALGCPDPG